MQFVKDFILEFQLAIMTIVFTGSFNYYGAGIQKRSFTNHLIHWF